MTLAEYVARWLPTLSVHVRTRQNYERSLRRHVLPLLGALPFTAIRRRDIRAMLKELLVLGHGERTVHNAYVALSSLYADALVGELVAENPAHGALMGIVRPRPPGWATIKALTRDQLAEFLTATTEVVPQLADYFYLLAGTGMRPSEGLGLQAGCVDGPNRRIHVRRQWLDGAEDLPKGRRTRWIEDVPHEVIIRLTSYDDGRQWCFPNPRTAVPWSPQTVQRCARIAFEAAHLPRKFTAHSLRHTWACLMLEITGDATYVSRQLGHSEIGVTCNLYGAGANPRHPEASDRLDALLHRRGPLRAGPSPSVRPASLPAADVRQRA